MANRTKHSYEKVSWRETNLAFIMREGFISQKQLRCSYIELLGDSGVDMFHRLRPYLPTAEHFIGVEKDIYTANRIVDLLLSPEYASDPFSFLKGDFYTACHQALVYHKPPPGIFNCDTSALAGIQNWWNHPGDDLCTILWKALEHYPRVALILNHVLDQRKSKTEKCEQRLIDHTNQIYQCFSRQWPSFRRRDLLENDNRSAKLVSDTGFVTGYVGAFEIYRSNQRSNPADPTEHQLISPMRMATIRLCFDRTQILVDHAAQQ